MIAAAVLERKAMVNVRRLAIDDARAAPARVGVAYQDPHAAGSPICRPVVLDLFRWRGLQAGRAVAFEA